MSEKSFIREELLLHITRSRVKCSGLWCFGRLLSGPGLRGDPGLDGIENVAAGSGKLLKNPEKTWKSSARDVTLKIWRDGLVTYAYVDISDWNKRPTVV